MLEPSGRLGVILTLTAAVGFALKTILAKLAYRHGIDPLTLLTLRLTVAGSVFASVLFYNVAVKKIWDLRFSARQWLTILALAFFGYYLSALLDFMGLVTVDANLGRMILFLYPTLVVLINAFIAGQKVRAHVWAALVLCYGGVALMVLPNLVLSPGPGFAKGCLLIFSSAVAYAGYLVGVDRFFLTSNVVRFITVILTISSLLVLVHFFAVRDPGLLVLPGEVYWLALLMGVFSTVIPCYAISAGIAMIGASRASAISMIGPVVTLLMSVMILGESVGPLQIVGMVLIIVGVSRVR
ncbi:MAG: DMT family transporter [Deltaproteobacteria bacterium]|nr:DMT family transporter [Deltaproteobacteria bacterium]